jgi:hypothetical protein
VVQKQYSIVKSMFQGWGAMEQRCGNEVGIPTHYRPVRRACKDSAIDPNGQYI